MDAKLKHNFINNALKIDIIHRIIEDELKDDNEIKPQLIQDLTELFDEQKEILNSSN